MRTSYILRRVGRPCSVDRRVWQAIQRIGDSVFLYGIQSADLGDVGLQSCNDSVCIRWESCIRIG